MGQCLSSNAKVQLAKSDTVIKQDLPKVSTGTTDPKIQIPGETVDAIIKESTEESGNSGFVINSRGFKSKDSPTSSTANLTHFTPLHELNPDHILNIPFKNEKIQIYVCDVHDGDTCTILFYINGYPMKTNLRILHIDAPEVKVKGKGKTDMVILEEQAGAKVRDVVKDLIYCKYTQVIFVKHDKFGGRLLAEVYIPYEDTTISQFLLDRRYAKPYSGQKKEPWTQLELEHILYH